MGCDWCLHVLRYPITVSFRLSEADATRLSRLLERYGIDMMNRGNSSRFRIMLKSIDSKLLSPWDSERVHDAFDENEAASKAEEIRFKHWDKRKFFKGHPP